MDPLTDYYVSRASDDRVAELRREADAFRLTRVLAEQHASLFPRARRLAAGLTGLAVPAADRTPAAGRTATAGRTRTAGRAVGQPCPC